MTRCTLLLAGAVVTGVAATFWLCLNTSPSVPLGLYWKTRVPTPLRRGTLVVLPVPERLQAWHSARQPLLKPVAAIAGDRVCWIDRTLYVWGVDYGPVLSEAHGLLLPQREGCLIVPPGEVFLASREPRSLDARYFSTVPIGTLTARAIPVVTWERAPHGVDTVCPPQSRQL